MQLVIPVKALRSGGGGGLSDKGGTLTSPLILSRNPQELLEAATKSYVDNSITSIPATKIDSGTFSAERLPQFIGDAVKGVGSTQINLSNSGVTAGQYSKIGLNEKGQAIMGFPLSGDDIPSVTWSKFKTNIPTTLSGYGITNGLPKVGGTLTGYLTAVNAPTQSLHVANKAYVDSIFVNSGKPETGDILRSHVTSTPTGFLRCNGAQISKTTYSALYAIIGDTYNFSNQPGAGVPWRQQAMINTVQDGSLANWVTSTALPIRLYNTRSVVTKNRVYLLGGRSDSGDATYSAAMYSADINADGTLTAWSYRGELPTPTAFAAVMVVKNNVYLLGGRSSGDSNFRIFKAAIVNGVIGVWGQLSAPAAAIVDPQVVVTKNRAYLIGGNDGTFPLASIYTATIDADGVIGSWTVSSSTLPNGVYDSQLVVTHNRVHLVGGHTTNYGSANVYSAPINPDGTLGAWVTGTSLSIGLRQARTVVTKNRVYLIGGIQSDGVISYDVYTAPINADGTLGTWVKDSNILPVRLFAPEPFVVKNKIYLVGGNSLTNGNGLTTVYTTTFSGGLNDYSPYYDGSITPTDSTSFKLPDFSSKEVDTLKYFIKY